MNLIKEDLLGIHKDRMKIGASLADVDPMHIDRTVRFQYGSKVFALIHCSRNMKSKRCTCYTQVGFESIGGLSKHISALKEMVVFPLLYPEVFERFKIQPPR